MKNTEYLIIGAGIIGSYTTYFLSDKRKQVVTVDSGACCAEASGVCAANLDILKLAPKMVPIAVEGIKIWGKFQTQLGMPLGFHRIGGINVAFTPEEAETGRIQCEALKAAGIAAEVVAGEELHKRFPYIAPEAIQATYSPFIAYADPNTAGPTVMREAVKKGAEFYSYHKVEKIVPDAKGGYFVKAGEDLEIHADKVLVCCGTRSNKLLDSLGYHFDFNFRKNIVIVTEKTAPLMPNLVTGTQLSMKQVENGSIIIGGGWQGYGDIESNQKVLSLPNLCGNLHAAQRIVPGLAKVNVLRAWVGFDSIYDNKLPIMTEVPGYENLFAAITGSVGFTCGPYVASQLAEIMDK